MKFGFIALAAMVASSASAQAATAYRCDFVGGVDEYVIEINLASKKAAFFDNNAWSIARLKSVRSLESNPPQTRYTFSGKGAYGDSITIVFNQTRMTASVSEDGVEDSVLRAEKCTAVSKSRLLSGI